MTPLEMVERGWCIFPLPSGSKVPFSGFKWRELSCNDPEQIKRWTQQYHCCGWAIDTGKSGLVVVDEDNKGGKSGADTLFHFEINKGFYLEKTLTVETPSGGKHYYFQGSTSSSNGKVGIGVDIKSQGGYVVAPGSIIGGKKYKILKDLPIVTVPDWLERMTGQPKVKDPRRDEPLVELDLPENIARAIDNLKNRAPLAVEGQAGDDTAFKVAAAVRDFGISAEQCLSLMLDHWNDRCEPPWDPQELELKVENANAYASSRAGAGTFEAIFDEPVESSFVDTEDTPWEEPVPLEASPRPDFPLGSLPEPLKDWVREVSHSLQVPLGMVATAALCIVATIIQNSATIVLRPEWIEPLCLFLLVAMESGERKSAVARLAQGALIRHEQTQSAFMKPEISIAKSLLRSLEHQLSQAEKMGEEVKREQLAIEVEEARAAIPVPKRFFVDDITAEQLAATMEEQGEAIAVFSAEASFIETAVGGRYSSNGAPNMELVLKSHAGDSYRMDRRNGTSIYLDSPRLTMAMIVQPEVIKDIAAKPGARGKGLLARILWSMPESRVGYRDINPPPISKAVASQYEELIKKLLAMGGSDD